MPMSTMSNHPSSLLFPLCWNWEEPKHSIRRSLLGALRHSLYLYMNTNLHTETFRWREAELAYYYTKTWGFTDLYCLYSNARTRTRMLQCNYGWCMMPREGKRGDRSIVTMGVISSYFAEKISTCSKLNNMSIDCLVINNFHLSECPVTRG